MNSGAGIGTRYTYSNEYCINIQANIQKAADAVKSSTCHKPMPSLVSERQALQKDAVPGAALAGPPAQPRLLPDRGHHKAPAPRDGQPVDKAGRRHLAQALQAVGAALPARLHGPEAHAPIARAAGLTWHVGQGGR